MNDAHYSNRELDSMFRAISVQITENHRDQKEQLDRIELQTMRTNGRVSKLENWRNWLTGIGVAIIILVLPLLTYIYKTNELEARQTMSTETNAK